MQIITMYLRADSFNARLVDSYNQTISSLPALTRGMRAELILKLLDVMRKANRSMEISPPTPPGIL